MSDNIKVLVVGAGNMGREYCKVLKALQIQPTVVCRTEKTAEQFENEIGIRPLFGGIETVIKCFENVFNNAIVAVDVENLFGTTMLLIEHDIKNILVEKPAGMNRKEIETICNAARQKGINIYVAYNRRFYASTEKALEIINNDGGVSSFNFEFTEWASSFQKVKDIPHIREEILLCNSSHVIDFAFFIGGEPIELHTLRYGSLPWHNRAEKYCGCGVCENGVLFSYQANWDAPGRWGVEVLTKEHRLFFRPMEKLSMQNKGSVKIEEVTLDDYLDTQFKPGLYNETKAFLSYEKDFRLVKIEDHLKHLGIYEKIDGLIP